MLKECIRINRQEANEVVKEAYQTVVEMIDVAAEEAAGPPRNDARCNSLARVRVAFDRLLVDEPAETIFRVVGCTQTVDATSLTKEKASDPKVERLAQLLETLADIRSAIEQTLCDPELTRLAILSEGVRDAVENLDVEAGLIFGLGEI